MSTREKYALWGVMISFLGVVINVVKLFMVSIQNIDCKCKGILILIFVQ
jgi:hypothetical protein